MIFQKTTTKDRNLPHRKDYEGKEHKMITPQSNHAFKT